MLLLMSPLRVARLRRSNPKVVGSFPTLVRVFRCPCVGPFPSVGLTLTWFIWDRNLALHITLRIQLTVFSQSSVQISAGLTDISGLAVAAFDLINCSLSVPRLVFVFDVSQ